MPKNLARLQDIDISLCYVQYAANHTEHRPCREGLIFGDLLTTYTDEVGRGRSLCLYDWLPSESFTCPCLGDLFEELDKWHICIYATLASLCTMYGDVFHAHKIICEYMHIEISIIRFHLSCPGQRWYCAFFFCKTPRYAPRILWKTPQVLSSPN